MLRVIPTRSAARAKGYYSHTDYYTVDQELPGIWRGKGANRLGLAGTVEKADFDALCDNRHPRTGGRVTGRNRGDRTVGYDFNFHAPKSVSLLNAWADDGAVLAAFRGAVDDTMRLVEADAQTRVRKGKASWDRSTGELVWARFDHLTSRPVGGVPDPHLHSHCFVQNMTFDGDEGAWKAGQFRELKRAAPFYQAVFHATLAAKLTALGYPLERTADGWEVAGIARATLDKFSRRTKQIEDLAAARGIVAADEKAELGARCREGKAKALSTAALRLLWDDRLDADERAALNVLPLSSGSAAPAGLDVRAALAFACRHLYERNSVVAERQLVAEMLRAGVGRFAPDEALAAIGDSDVIVREIDGRRLATTRAVLAEEERVVAFARDGRGRCAPLGRELTPTARGRLNDGQAAAANHILTSPDRVMVIRGAAGSGKTTLMREAVARIERGGTKVFAFAPSAEASRGVLRQEGFRNAETVARLLIDEKLQAETRGQVLWVDEAGLLGSRTMGQLFDLAARNDNRVVLSGDNRQHGAVERGAVLRVLETQAGVRVAEVKDIQRQRGAYKAAVEHLADGRTERGLDALDALGWVREVADADRDRRLAAEYVATIEKNRTALVVSPTHAEGAAVTAAIRDALRAAGRLGADERRLPSLTRVDRTEAERGRAEGYRPGDVLQFHQNSKGFRTGDRLVVGAGGPLPLDQAARFQVFRPGEIALAVGDRVRVTKGGVTKDGHKLENGSLYDVAGFTREGDVRLRNGWVVDRNFGHLALGYVSTSHASQGKTVDHVLIAQSSRSAGVASREQFYVSASRARQSVTIYTDDKAALRDAIGRSDGRMAAVELVGRDRRRDAARLHHRLDRAHDREPVVTPAHAGRELREGGRGG